MQNGKVHLEDLTEDAVSVDLVSPKGRIVTVHMRALKDGEIRGIRRRVVMPSPPVTDMRRNSATGQVEKVYNDQDPTYIQKLEDANARVVILGVLTAVTDLDVPGETDDERCDAYQQTVEAWASGQLIDAFNRVNGFTPPAMQEAKENITPFGVESLPSLPDSVGVSESGTD